MAHSLQVVPEVSFAERGRPVGGTNPASVKNQPTQEELEAWQGSPLLNYLQSQQSAGRFDSSDGFSVNILAAQRKYGRYALPRPSAWILKFVQCATELGCPELRITLDSEEVAIAFPSEAPFAELGEMEDRLETLSPDSAAQEHLFGGLLALHNLEGEVLVEHRGRRWRPLTEAALEPCPEGESLRCVYRPARLRFWEKFRRRVSGTLSLLDELETWCYACPVTLVVDSRPLDPAQAVVPLISGLLEAPESTPVLQVGGRFERTSGKGGQVYSRWGGRRPNKVGAAVMVDHTLSGRRDENVSLDWLRSGVVVHREATRVKGCHRLLTRVVLPSEGLRFDLSGFAFEENELSRGRRLRGTYSLNQALLAARGELGREGRWERFLKEQPDLQTLAVSEAEPLIDELSALLEVVRE